MPWVGVDPEHSVDFDGLDPADIVTMLPGAFVLRPSRALAGEIMRSLKGAGVENPLRKAVWVTA
jgi:hypothetical protein